MSGTPFHPFALSLAEFRSIFSEHEGTLGDQTSSRRRELLDADDVHAILQSQLGTIAPFSLSFDELQQQVESLLAERGISIDQEAIAALVQQIANADVSLDAADDSGDTSIPADDSVTTMALGEEGGDGYTDEVSDDASPTDDLVTTRALGEEGGDDTDKVSENEADMSDGCWVTTLALGEEGGDGYTDEVSEDEAVADPVDDLVTTLALGEEGGDGYTDEVSDEEAVVDPADGWATTLALGEEGGDGYTDEVSDEEAVVDPADGWATTLALGEEGGDGYTDEVSHGDEDVLDPGQFTTMALGEEGGDRWDWDWCFNPSPVVDEQNSNTGDPIIGTHPALEITTLALGEEGGDSGLEEIGEDWLTTLALGEEGGSCEEVWGGDPLNPPSGYGTDLSSFSHGSYQGVGNANPDSGQP